MIATMKIHRHMPPVFICAQGPSLSGLQDNIQLLHAMYPDAIWAGMNDYTVVEERCLALIGKQFDYMYFSDWHLIHIYGDKVREFLHRPHLNHFVSDYDSMRDIEERCGYRIANVNGSVIYSSQSRGKNPDVVDAFYNSLTALLLTMIALGHREFFLFGCDGGGDPRDPLYFGVDAGIIKDELPPSELSRRLAQDTKFMNDWFWALAKKITDDDIDIFNVCPNSFIDCFTKVSYQEICAHD